MGLNGSVPFLSDRVKLSDVHALYLRRDVMTTSRRNNSIPQLQCSGFFSHCILDKVQCYNDGTDGYDVKVSISNYEIFNPRFNISTYENVCSGNARLPWMIAYAFGTLMFHVKGMIIPMIHTCLKGPVGYPNTKILEQTINTVANR